MKLNSHQEVAAADLEGNLCCLARAGTGKTKTVVARVVNILESGISPDSILVSTFTAKAGNKLRQDISDAVGKLVASATNTGTMHSIFLKFLKRYYNNFYNDIDFSCYNLIKDFESIRIVKNMINRSTKYKHLFTGNSFAVDVYSKISYIRNVYVDRIEMCRELIRKNESIYVDLMDRYEKKKKSINGIDFDDILVLFLKMLRENNEVREEISSKFNHIIVDEYQDTNKIQVEILRMLNTESNSIFVVGDDMQAIYGWRGATSDNILKFNEMFGGRSIPLPITYRNRATVATTANRLIVNGGERIQTIKTGGSVEYLGMYANQEAEAKAVIAKIIRMKNEKMLKWGDFMVIYRNNSQEGELAFEAMAKRVPYTSKESVSFFESSSVKEMIEFIKLAKTSKVYAKSILSICTRYNSVLADSFKEEFKSKVKAGMSTLDALASTYSTGFASNKARNLSFLIKRFREKCVTFKNLGEIVACARTMFGLDAVKGEETDSGDKDKLSTLNDFESLCSGISNVKDLLNIIKESGKDKTKDGTQDCITLSTIHSIKGCESRVVFICGANEGILPSSQSENRNEERNLMYVAVTRAMDKVCISGFSRRFNVEYEKSSFLEEMKLC